MDDKEEVVEKIIEWLFGDGLKDYKEKTDCEVIAAKVSRHGKVKKEI